MKFFVFIFGAAVVSGSLPKRQRVASELEIQDAAELLASLSQFPSAAQDARTVNDNEFKVPPISARPVHEGSLLRAVAIKLAKDPRSCTWSIRNELLASGNTYDFDDVDRARNRVLRHISVPQRTHQALLALPADADDPTLLAAVPGSLKHIRDWLRLCIAPLRAGVARCGPKGGNLWTLYSKPARDHLRALVEEGTFDSDQEPLPC
jgi:hypothetical protein